MYIVQIIDKVFCVYVTVGEREKLKLKPGYNRTGKHVFRQIQHT